MTLQRDFLKYLPNPCLLVWATLQMGWRCSGTWNALTALAYLAVLTSLLGCTYRSRVVAGVAPTEHQGIIAYAVPDKTASRNNGNCLVPVTAFFLCAPPSIFANIKARSRVPMNTCFLVAPTPISHLSSCPRCLVSSEQEELFNSL